VLIFTADFGTKVTKLSKEFLESNSFGQLEEC